MNGEEPSGSGEEGCSISLFDYSAETHLKAVDSISNLCGEEAGTDIEKTDIDRLSSSVTLLRECRHFSYELFGFYNEAGKSYEPKDISSHTLPQFSSARAPKVKVHDDESSSFGELSDDSSNFECNICLDLAQDPIVTLRGHLFCWPCIYKWLHLHSNSKECPVCKALIEEDRLVPLYGRGKSSTDPRSKSIPGIQVPNRRPSGQRPETAQPPDPNHGFAHHSLGGFMGGFAAPVASARFGNVTLSAAFGGLIPSLFNLHFHGFPDAAMYGATAASSGSFLHGFSNPFHGGHSHMHSYHRHTGRQGQQDYHLKALLCFVFIIVVFSLILS